jgi:hypothetical protein
VAEAEAEGEKREERGEAALHNCNKAASLSPPPLVPLVAVAVAVVANGGDGE